MKKWIVRVSVFSILYLLALVWLVFVLHVLNRVLQLSSRELFICYYPNSMHLYIWCTNWAN